MKKIILSGVLCISSFVTLSQTIADVRNMGIGQTVTIKGVVTNGSELGSIRYVQDATAALPIYGTGLNSLLRGDSVTATGPLLDFNGLLEISPVSNFVDHGPSLGGLPDPLPVPLSVINESIEAQLVRVDNVTFVQTGNFASGNSTVQITDGTTTFAVRINGTTNIDGSVIPTGPVSIVGLAGQFNANYQLVPRDLNDIFTYVAPSREINVKMGGTTVLNNGTYVIGNTSSTNVSIENSGSLNLTVSSTGLSGTNAADFSGSFSGIVGPTSSQSFTLNFAPSGTGTRTATLSINNDDSDENPYVITLSAVGTDNLATEPTTNPTNLTFPLLKAYTLGGQYNAGVNAEKYIVLWKTGSAVTGVPTDGTTYKRGDVIGDAKVAYIGSGMSFTPRHVIANQNYHFSVYAFNGPDGFENYKTTSPAIGNATSQGQQIGNYYNVINSSSPNFLTDLSSLINPHNFVSYFNYKTTMMNQFEVRDTTDGQSYVVCVYSGERKVFNDPFDWTPIGYSREHTYSHSWMPTFPADGPPEKPEYTDQHNLYPTNLQNANTPRSNLPLDIITGNTVFSFLNCAVGYNSSNQLCFTPRPEQRGNAARSIFYMATCYNGQSGNNWQIPSNQNQDILKQWHYSDLPDNYEIARHEYVYTLQNNRNPYIDSTDFVCHVNFSNMTYNACEAGLQEKLEANFSVFPVPSNNRVYAQVNGLNITSYRVTDAQGRMILEKNDQNLPVLELVSDQFKSGVYILSVGTIHGSVQSSFIIE
ncbi:MAG: choice-of-anchor D domain-containing protein [Bacteroidetes bacterium]|nr:choice-of-anchor D domain-containing protein [Bacteroidota bacterium]